MIGISIVLAVIAFVLLYIYDICTVKKPDSYMTRYGFYIGFLMTVIATVCAVIPLDLDSLSGIRVICGTVLVLFGIVCLIWALFFSLPKGTYVDPSLKRKVYDKGLYALCRHPGFWPFLVLYIGLYIIFGGMTFIPFGILCIMNLLYIILQDLWTFRQIFEDYDVYSKKVPFLVPNRNSITRWNWLRRSGKD